MIRPPDVATRFETVSRYSAYNQGLVTYSNLIHYLHCVTKRGKNVTRDNRCHSIYVAQQTEEYY